MTSTLLQWLVVPEGEVLASNACDHWLDSTKNLADCCVRFPCCGLDSIRNHCRTRSNDSDKQELEGRKTYQAAESHDWFVRDRPAHASNSSRCDRALRLFQSYTHFMGVMVKSCLGIKRRRYGPSVHGAFGTTERFRRGLRAGKSEL